LRTRRQYLQLLLTKRLTCSQRDAEVDNLHKVLLIRLLDQKDVFGLNRQQRRSRCFHSSAVRRAARDKVRAINRRSN
jgi:hypothetical protein